MPEHSKKTWVPSDESRKNGLKKIKLVTGSVKVVKQSIQPLLYYFCSIGQKKKMNAWVKEDQFSTWFVHTGWQENWVVFNTYFHWWLRWQRVWLLCKRPGFDPWRKVDALEKGTATHSSILAWRIPWT